MSNLAQNNLIQPSVHINYFYQNVINIIFAGNVYSIYNIPYNGSFQCVPTSYLGNPNDVYIPATYGSEQIIKADDIYNHLIAMTKILTRLGTFTHTSRRQVTRWATSCHSNYYDMENTVTGRCFYSEAYTISNVGYPNNLPGVDRCGVETEHPLTASSLINLIRSCLNAINNSSKPSHSKIDDYCHDSCHDNCHSSCHGNCYNCYGSASDHCYGNSHSDGGYLNVSCRCFAPPGD